MLDIDAALRYLRRKPNLSKPGQDRIVRIN